MASQTSALPDGSTLTKPAYTDSADIAVINTNMDKIVSNINAENQALSNKFNANTSIMTSLSDLKQWFITNGTGAVRVNNSVGVLLSGRSRQGVVYGFKTSDEYIIFAFEDSNGDLYSGYITTATDDIVFQAITDTKTIFVQLNNQTINGSTSTMESTTFDLSSYIPSGFAIWSAEVQIQEGSSYYNLPWFNASLTQVTFIEKIANAAVTVRNKASWTAGTRMTFTLHCKKS